MLSGAAFAAACWVKEVALIALAVLLIADLLRRRASWWPLRLDRMQTAWAGALVVGVVPTLITLAQGGITPGGPGDPDVAVLLDQLVVTAWLWPVLLVGLWLPRARWLALVGLLLPVWYLVYAVVFGQGVNIWYLVLPNVLALAACAAILDRLWDDGPRRSVTRGAAVLIAVALLAHVVAPMGVADRIKNPASGFGEDDHDGTWAYESNRGLELDRLHTVLGSRGQEILFVDVYGADMLHPYAGQVEGLWVGATWTVRFLDQDLAQWTEAFDRLDAVVVHRNEEPLNQAIRLVYADCERARVDPYIVYDGGSCPGRLDDLRVAYEARLTPDPAGA